MAHDDWAKMDARLDSHPKIRRAGRDGREVFLFAVRRNRLRGGGAATGRLPATDFEPWYLADQLMMPEADAAVGIERAVSAGLLSRDGDEVVICGFDEDWGGRAPMTEAERKRLQRSRRKEPCPDSVRTVTDASDMTVTVRNVTEIRGEEKRSESGERETPAGARDPRSTEPGLDRHRAWTLDLRQRRLRLVLGLRSEGIGLNTPAPSLVVDAKTEAKALHLVQRWAAIARAAGRDPEVELDERGGHLLTVLEAQCRARKSLSSLREETCWSPEVVGWAENVEPEEAAAAPQRGQRAAPSRKRGGLDALLDDIAADEAKEAAR